MSGHGSREHMWSISQEWNLRIYLRTQEFCEVIFINVTGVGIGSLTPSFLAGFGFWSPHSHLNVNNFILGLKAERNYFFNWGKQPKWLSLYAFHRDLEMQAGRALLRFWGHVVSTQVMLAHGASQCISTANKMTWTLARSKKIKKHRSYLLQWVHKSRYITSNCCIPSGKVKSLH